MRRNSFSVSFVVLAALAACGTPPASNFKTEQDTTEGGGGPGQFGESAGPGDDAEGGCVQDPSFYDVPGDGCDNDGDGEIDNPPACDDSVGSSAEDFARAIGICDKASERGFGLVSATFTQGYKRTAAPKPQQHGVLPKFGDVLRPREGKMLGVLSTGIAQEFDGGKEPFSPGKDMWNGGGDGALPPGFPKAAGSCPQSTEVHDVIALKLELKAPKNASGFRFDFDFFSSEWPEFICSQFNDGFIAYLSAKGFNGGKPDNISFDSKNNPVSVNNGFFDRCTPGITTGCSGSSRATSICPGGTEELSGTGFGLQATACGLVFGKKATQGGATGWLSSQAPVEPGETFTLELMIWDTGDGTLDSSVLLDNFQWLGGAVETSTERPPGPK